MKSEKETALAKCAAAQRKLTTSKDGRVSAAKAARLAGATNIEIARAMGLTETAVRGLLIRNPDSVA